MPHPTDPFTPAGNTARSTAVEEQAAEERARSRLDRVQQLIHEEDSHDRLH